MSKILIIGSINQDIVANVSKIPNIGETVIAKDSKIFFGGKGANQAIACSRLGGKCYFLGKVGNDKFGKEAVQNLFDNNIDSSGVIVENNELTGMAFITVEDSGNNSIVVMGNCNQTITFEDILKNEHLIDQCEFILMQLEIPYEIIKKVVFLAHEKGKKIILNPAPSLKIEDEVLSKLYCITPNEHEAYGILGQTEKFNKNSKEMIKNLFQTGKTIIEKGVENVIITIGDKGILHINEDNFKHYDAFKVSAVDTTGAGDTFNGALLYHLSKGYSFPKAILNAQGAAAISTLELGAQTSMPDSKQLNEFLNKHGYGENINIL
jgi:ribokinase